MRRCHFLLPIFLLAGCGNFGGDAPSGPTLSDLKPVELETDAAAVPAVSLDELVGIYRSVLEHQDDALVRTQILHRLADIEMLASEDRLAGAIDSHRLFDPAISAYEKLLHENPDYERRDTILYQLSKAYDLRGDAQLSMATLERLKAGAPDSPYLAEASFRLAERNFANANYPAAEAVYEQVTQFGAETPFYTRSLYMLGWSLFKQSRYYDAVAPFTASLDAVLHEGIDVAELPRSQREITEDSLRVLALAFSNLNGTQTIVEVYSELGVRPYQPQLYEALGGLYLSQDRFRDSAQVYQDFLAHHPDTPLAHDFQLRVIAAFEAGGFPALILAAKQDYVAKFAVDSDYWQSSQALARESMEPTLRRFLEELASHFHALAQAANGATITNNKHQSAQEASAHYSLAAQYYREFIASFPTDPAVPEKMFLLAQSLLEAGEHPQAISAYEAMAYTYPKHAQAAEAAYRGILAHTERDVSEAAIAAKLRFANTFVEDERAVVVLGDAARQLFSEGQYEAAIAAANELLARNADSALKLAALLVTGHSHFALDRFERAETAYLQALPLIPTDDSRYGDTRQRIAATLYRQAELRVGDEENSEAAALFERAMDAAPRSDIAVSALYDAATAHFNAGDLGSANALYLQFRERYPEHALSVGIGPLLVRNYEQLEDWERAAAELDTIAGDATDPEQGRQALIVAAQYYDKVGAAGPAISRYRRYAHEWPSPMAPRLEAMHRLTQLYGGQAKEFTNKDKVDFWMRKLEAVHAEAGSEQTPRSAYLAAYACTHSADGVFSEFRNLPLKQPIKKSLTRKRQVMQNVLQAYSRCSSYAIEQFTTLSNLRIGLTYQALSEALMDSERPGSLDALALEQYEMMLEEQAYPFEDKAIAVLESNVKLCWKSGVYDDSVKASFAALAALLPARYAKQEEIQPGASVSNEQPRKRGKRSKLLKLNEAAISRRVAGDFAGARKKYEKALALADDDAITHRNIGILFELYLGKPEQALEHYRRYQAITGGVDRSVAGWIALLERRKVSVAGGV